jgi:hypothetical protein
MDKTAKIRDLDSFALLGKEGSSAEGPGFVDKLWNEAERGLPEIGPALKTDKFGPLYWGAMSSFARDLGPWEHDFKDGLYLAGFEMIDPNLIPPDKWIKWEIPARKYFVIPVGADYGISLAEGLKALREEGYVLSGAVFDHLAKGILYLYYPIEAIS